MNIDRPTFGSSDFLLQTGPFETVTMPETIQQMWGPVPLRRLPEGEENKCVVASHR